MPVRSFVISMIVLSFVFALDTHAVYACSGGAPLTVKGLLARSDYVVKARAIESDDAGQNVILQVESYLVGGPGPEFILFSRLDPVFTEYILAGRSSGADCLGLVPALRPSDNFYAFLHRKENGSYSAVSTLFNQTPIAFPSDESTVEVFLEGGFQNGEQIFEDFAERGSGQQVSESEFVALIATESNEQPSPPSPTHLYPLKSPLLITTSSEQFVLPVDWQTPLQVDEETFHLLHHPMSAFGFSDALRCSRQGEIIISPDGLNVAIIGEENTICLTWESQLAGQAATFSTTSDTIAVWNNCQLSIYTLGYPRLAQEWFTVDFVNSVDLVANDCSIFHGSAAWSPDGRLLAFADDRGILLWDAFTPTSQPQQILTSTGAMLRPNFFSQQGRYLNYSDGDGNHHIDLISGEIIPDGVMSPDDRLLIKFDTDAESSAFEICSLAPYSCVNGYPISIWFLDEEGNMERFYDLYQISKVAWKDSSSFLTLACTNDDYGRCAVATWFIEFYGWKPAPISEAIDFDYDRGNGVLAYIRDETTIVVNGVQLQTSQWFNEEVQSLTWLPSLFYQD